MFGIGTSELLVILVVALIVVGPQRLPEIARGLGKALGELRRATGGLTDELRNARIMLEHEAQTAMQLPRTQEPSPARSEPTATTIEEPSSHAPAAPAAAAASAAASADTAASHDAPELQGNAPIVADIQPSAAAPTKEQKEPERQG